MVGACSDGDVFIYLVSVRIRPSLAVRTGGDVFPFNIIMVDISSIAYIFIPDS